MIKQRSEEKIEVFEDFECDFSTPCNFDIKKQSNKPNYFYAIMVIWEMSTITELRSL